MLGGWLPSLLAPSPAAGAAALSWHRRGTLTRRLAVPVQESELTAVIQAATQAIVTSLIQALRLGSAQPSSQKEAATLSKAEKDKDGLWAMCWTGWEIPSFPPLPWRSVSPWPRLFLACHLSLFPLHSQGGQVTGQDTTQ